MQILVSACLLGEKVRYNGSAVEMESPWLRRLCEENRVHAFCPEVAAGLPVPRPCAEIVGGNGRDVLAGRADVVEKQGRILTEDFIRGARRALALCGKKAIVLAVLTENSPSCGSSSIYNGAFTGEKIGGCGVTTALLEQNGIKVFSQRELAEAARSLAEIAAGGTLDGPVKP